MVRYSTYGTTSTKKVLRRLHRRLCHLLVGPQLRLDCIGYALTEQQLAMPCAGLLMACLAACLVANPAVGQESNQTASRFLQLHPHDRVSVTAEQVIQHCTDILQTSDKLTRLQIATYHWRRGLAYYNLADFVNAESDLSEVIRLCPANLEARLDYARVLIALEKHDEVIKCLEQIKANDAEYSDALSLRSQSYCNQARNTEALAFADRALEANPKNPLGYAERACANFRLVRLDRALDDCSEALRLLVDVENPLSYNPGKILAIRGVIRLGSGNTKAALADFLKGQMVAQNQSPLAFAPWIWACYLQEGRYAACQQVLGQLTTELLRDNLEEYFLRAVDQLIEGKSGQAIVRIKKELKNDSSTPRIWLRFGMVQYAAGEHRGALESLQKARKLSRAGEEDLEVRALSTYVLSASPDADDRNGKEALTLATEISQITSDRNPRYLMLLAMARAECGQFDQAASTAKKALEKLPTTSLFREEYSKRIRLFEDKKPYRYDYKAKVWDFLVY